jgi:molybdate transport system substrate-binding protein
MAPQGIKVICAGGFRAAMEKIAPAWEASHGVAVTLAYGTPAATRAATIEGAGFDAVVVTTMSLDDEARARLGPAWVVAKSPIGVGFAPAVGPWPVATLPELVAAVRAVRSVGLSDPRAGTSVGADILAAAERLGFGDDLRARAHFVAAPGAAVSGRVARGEFDAVMTLASEIVTVPGVVYGGPLPEVMGLGVPFEAALGARAEAPQAAQAFLDHLRTEGARAIMRGTGLLTPA